MKINNELRRNKNKGITLIEIIVAVALTTVVGTAVLTFSIFVINANNKTTSKTSADISAYLFLDTLEKRVCSAQKLEQTDSYVAIDRYAYTISDSSEVIGTQSLVIESEPMYLIYDNNQLYLLYHNTLTENDAPILKNVTDYQCTVSNNTTLSVSFNVTIGNNEHTYSRVITTRAD